MGGKHTAILSAKRARRPTRNARAKPIRTRVSLNFTTSAATQCDMSETHSGGPSEWSACCNGSTGLLHSKLSRIACQPAVYVGCCYSSRAQRGRRLASHSTSLATLLALLNIIHSRNAERTCCLLSTLASTYALLSWPCKTIPPCFFFSLLLRRACKLCPVEIPRGR